jgi:hypothetical protein
MGVALVQRTFEASLGAPALGALVLFAPLQQTSVLAFRQSPCRERSRVRTFRIRQQLALRSVLARERRQVLIEPLAPLLARLERNCSDRGGASADQARALIATLLDASLHRGAFLLAASHARAGRM